MKLLHILRFLCYMFFLIPILVLVIWSMVISWRFEDVLPSVISFRYILHIFTSGNYIILIKSLIFSFAVAVASIIIAVLASSSLVRMKKSYTSWIEILFYLPMLLPTISICLGLHRILLSIPTSAMLNIFLLHVYFSFPYAFKVIFSAHKQNGYKIINTGKNLGLSDIRILAHLEIPMLKKDFYGAFIFSFAVSYGQYFINYFFGDIRTVNFSMILAPFLATSNRSVSAAYILYFIGSAFIGIFVFKKGVNKCMK